MELITLKCAALMLHQKTPHPFRNVGNQNTVLCTETRSCSSGITTPDDRAVLTRPPLQAPILRPGSWTHVALSLEI